MPRKGWKSREFGFGRRINPVQKMDGKTFIIDEQMVGHGEIVRSITCNKCGHRSFNTNDIDNKYCGHCNMFHD